MACPDRALDGVEEILMFDRPLSHAEEAALLAWLETPPSERGR